MSSMKEGTSAQLSGRGELHGGARVTTLVTLRKCTLGYKREIKTLKFVSASTKGFKGGLASIKPSKKDMAVTFSYSFQCMQRGCNFGSLLLHANLVLAVVDKVQATGILRPLTKKSVKSSQNKCQNVVVASFEL